jgi:hypothetical protein
VLRAQRAGCVAERAADLEDGVLEGLRSGRRRLLAPERVDQPLGRDRLVAVDQQQREQCTLPPAGERQVGRSVGQFQRTKDPIVYYLP